MTTGLFTPTEGAIAACVWAMILGFVWYRTLNWKMFVKVCLDTVETTSTVLFIVAAASIFGWMLTATGVTADIAAWVLAFTKEAWVFLLLANLLMLDLADQKTDEAIAEMRRGVVLSDGTTRPLALLGSHLARIGQREEAREILNQLLAMPGTPQVIAVSTKPGLTRVTVAPAG